MQELLTRSNFSTEDLIKGLNKYFPQTSKCIGDLECARIANLIHKSTQQDLWHTLKAFPVYLWQDKLSRTMGFLPELADLDWKQHQIANQFEEIGLDENHLELQKISQKNAYVSFVSSLEIEIYRHSIYEIWQNLKAGLEIPSQWNHPQGVLIYKKHGQAVCVTFQFNEIEFLLNLQSKEDLKEAKIQTCIGDESVQKILSFLIKNNLIKNVGIRAVN